MLRKECSSALLLFVTGTFLTAADAVLPGDIGTIRTPDAWDIVAGTPLLLRGPGGSTAPRLALAAAPASVADAAESLRQGWRRVADGCEIIDDDDQPLGGRVWRRIRVRFAIGPLAMAQTAWVGTVGGRTMVAVLSCEDDAAARHLPAATRAIASISVR